VPRSYPESTLIEATLVRVGSGPGLRATATQTTGEPRLTIVLPLKGRHLFTLRFLWFANKLRLPYRFVIADGQVHEGLAQLLEDSRKLFPALDIDYVRYPDDSDFRRFFAKIVDALARVTTRYVMLADNDDFLVPAGIERSLDFLDAHADYVCAGGGIAGFSVYARNSEPLARLVGPLNKFTRRYAPNDRPIDLGSASAMERLTQGLRISWGYYAVTRTPVSLKIWREVLEMNLSDLQLHERFCALRALSIGKARSDPTTVAYIRQYWTSSASAFTKDWAHHLVRSRFSTDFAGIIDRIAAQVAASDSIDAGAAADHLREGMVGWYQSFLRRNYGLFAVVRRHLRTRAPSLLQWLKTRRRYSVPLERRAIFSELQRNGASASYLKTFRGELAQIEDVLTGTEFRCFIAPFVVSLSADASR
jgi:glycosyltransferase domain-containing protein